MIRLRRWLWLAGAAACCLLALVLFAVVVIPGVLLGVFVVLAVWMGGRGWDTGREDWWQRVIREGMGR